MATKDQTRAFRRLVESMVPELRAAFLEAIRLMKDGVDREALARALLERDIDAAVAALNIDPSAFTAYSQTTTAAYTAGATLAVETVNLPDNVGKVRFDLTNPTAQAWLKENALDRVREELVPEIREAARITIVEGYALGKHPDNIALDLVGRMSGGRRQGGVIGLDDYLQGHVRSMEARLRSGDPNELKKVLRHMSRRDHTLDRFIHRALETGKPIPDATIQRMLGRYTDRLAQFRAETIARTETGTAVMAGRRETWGQTLTKLGKPPEAVLKTWRHGGGVKDPRPHHQDMNGKTVRGLDTPFNLSSGASMRYALDPNGGAAECANCTCGTDFRIDHSWGLD